MEILIKMVLKNVGIAPVKVGDAIRSLCFLSNVTHRTNVHSFRIQFENTIKTNINENLFSKLSEVILQDKFIFFFISIMTLQRALGKLSALCLKT